MRKIPVILLLAFFAMPAIYGQIKIGDNPQAISPTSVLELESNDRVLVITRINTAQMDAIIPNQGAMAYNTDTQCIHYYNGVQWINLCNSAGLGFTTDPIVNDVSTIVITDQAGTKNFEVAPNSIGSLQIINGGINGVDIQNGSIGPGKLQNQSVTQEKLSENSVGAFALDNANINLSDFTNDQGFITIADVISTAAGNDIIDNGGAFYDDETLQNDIVANTAFINAHIAADGDTNANNEIQSLTLTGNQLGISGSNTVTLPSTTGEIDDNELITNMVLNGSNELVITEGANPPVQVDLSSLAGGGNQNLAQVLAQGTDGGAALIKNILDPVDPQDAATMAYVDANAGGNQNLGQVLAQGTDGGAALIKNILDPVDPQDAATMAYVDAAVTGGGTLADGTILIGDAGNNPVSQTISGDATLANDGTLTIAANAIDTGEIDNDAILLEDLNQNFAGDGQIIKWNDTAGLWEIADDDTGTATLTDGNIFVGGAGDVPTDVTLSGDATIDNLGELTIADDAIELNMIAQNAAADGDVMRWDDIAGEWIVEAAPGEHTGTAQNIFYAATDGTPTTADDNAFTNDDGGLFYDPEGRQVGGQRWGALYVGLDGGTPSTEAKVHISDNFPGVAYALQLQNQNATSAGRTTGILFSTEGSSDSYGKGALVYEWQGSWARGDFHFLQNPTFGAGTNVNPTLADAAFTIKNNKDIQLYGGIDVDGTPTGLGTPGQVLTSTGAGVQWGTGGGEINTGSNEGTGGVATFIQKTGTNLEFRSVNTGSNKITVIDDAANNEIVIDVVDANLALAGTQVSYDPTSSGLTATDTQAAIDELAGTAGGANLSNTDLIQTGGNRTYDLDNQDLYFVGAGSVGIGTTNPENKFHVAGEIRSEGYNSTFGSTGAPAYSFATSGNPDTNTGMYRPAADQIGFSVGGFEALRIEEPSTGNTNVIVSQSLELSELLLDENGTQGNVGDVLTATVTGTQWADPVVLAMGKLQGGNTIREDGGTVSGAGGAYTITLDNARPTADYIIQLAVEGDNRIYITAQTVNSFSVEIKDNGTGNLTTADWHYTVLDF